MGTNYNPKIVTNGLMLCLDAALLFNVDVDISSGNVRILSSGTSAANKNY